jgi:hypothetical protein
MGLTGRTGLLMLSALAGDRNAGDRNAFRFQVLPGARDTLRLAVGVVAGSPEPTWHFHDGTAQTGLSVTKTYAAAGTYPVTLRLPGLRTRISRLNFANQPVKFDLAQVRGWTALTRIEAHGKAATVVTGQLRDLPATMTTLDLDSTSSTITPGVGVRARAIRELYLDSTGMSQAAVDAIAEWLYINRAQFTYTAPMASLAGTNAAPSGIYQDADPPTTGKEYIYKVENDPEGEGFNKWYVAYTA